MDAISCNYSKRMQFLHLRLFRIIIIFGLISCKVIAREVRGKVLAIRRSDYIYAGEVSGANSIRIIIKHIIPNVLSRQLLSQL